MLIFDYDGVLLNSVCEMAVTAYNTVSGGLATSLEELPGHAAGLFLTNRFHVQPAGDAVTLMTWCVAHADLPPDYRLTPEAYLAIRDGADTPVVERTTRFFATRRRFVAHDIGRWRSLNSVYQPLWDTLREKGAARVVILTNKNREATVNLCHHFGLQVRPENIYSGDHGVTKIENLLRIQERFGRNTYTFVDDSIANLRELDAHFNVERPVIRLLLAAWGYVGPDDEALARHAGYPYILQESLIARLDTELPAAENFL
jgi:phosphoglycolate phosphatase-like HAD superfamily hydrolase